MKADTAFFDATKEACKAKSDEWDTRKSLREEELDGITKALEVLTSDEARELFAASIKPGKETGMDTSKDTGRDISFLQLDKSVGSEFETSSSARAWAALKTQARNVHSIRLALLAAQVREAKAGHFDEVIKSINTMITTLKEENTADIEKRDQCID